MKGFQATHDVVQSSVWNHARVDGLQLDMQLKYPLLILRCTLRCRLNRGILSKWLLRIQDVHHIIRISNALKGDVISPILDDPSRLWLPRRIRLASTISSLTVRNTTGGGKQSASAIVYDNDLTLTDVGNLPVLVRIVIWARGSPE